jgi:hypothetical protein
MKRNKRDKDFLKLFELRNVGVSRFMKQRDQVLFKNSDKDIQCISNFNFEILDKSQRRKEKIEGF